MVMYQIPKISKKGRKQIISDEETYEYVWNTKIHSCEECGRFLGDDFKDEAGRINKSVFSHILSKAAFPEFRNNPKNFNLLCFPCHQKWEFGNKASMNIFDKNEVTIDLLKSGTFNTEISRCLYDVQIKARSKFSVGRAYNYVSSLREAVEHEDYCRLYSAIKSLEVEYSEGNLLNMLECTQFLISKYKNRNLYQ